MSTEGEVILEYLKKNVKGEKSVFWPHRIHRDLQMPLNFIEEELDLLVEDGYLTKQYMFIDARDEAYEFTEEEAKEAYKTGVGYHPDTLDPFDAKFIRADYLSTKQLSKKGYFRHAGWYNDNVYVIRTDEMERVKSFFESFGMSFDKEKHGKGPEHYACENNGKVLEIYPVKR